MHQPPTPRQLEIAEFLGDELKRRGVMPTQREIATRFGFASPNAVRSHLRLMEKKGMVSLLPGIARGLKLTITSSRGIPILGKIAAGVPQEAIQTAEEFLPLPSDYFRGSDLFALRVNGDSMKDAGILSGDIAVLHWQQDVADGEIAAVLLDDEATLKQVHRRRDCVVLRGANPTFQEIIIRHEEARTLRILGKYVGLVRRHGNGN